MVQIATVKMLPVLRLFSVLLTSGSYRQPFLSDYTKREKSKQERHSG